MNGRIGFAGIAIVPIACCALLPLPAAGASVAAVVAASGVGVAVVAALGSSCLIKRKNVKEVLVSHDCCANATGEGVASGDAARPLVEILYFDGCPNHEGARALVERVSRELGVDPELRLVNVPDEESAQRLHFLGSPTIRITGEDVDPHAGERDDYVLSCRVYRTESGFAGQPDERWVRDALRPEAPNSKTTASNPA